MTNIKEISPESALGKVGRGQPAAPKPPEESAPEKAGGAPEQKDILQLDEKRRQEVRLTENARLLLEELPDVRPERVEEVRRRLREGFYDDPEVVEKVVDKILEELSERRSAARNLESEPEVREGDSADSQRLQQARRRLAHVGADADDRGLRRAGRRRYA